MKTEMNVDALQECLDTSRKTGIHQIFLISMGISVVVGGLCGLLSHSLLIAIVFSILNFVFYVLYWGNFKRMHGIFKVDKMQKEKEELLSEAKETQKKQEEVMAKVAIPKHLEEYVAADATIIDMYVTSLEAEIEFYKKVPERNFWQYLVSLKWLKKVKKS